MTKVLKGGGGPTRLQSPRRRAGGGVIDGAVFEAERDAAAIRAEAERLASEIVARAERQAKDLLEEARRRGREEGLAEATGLVARAHAERRRILDEAEVEMRTLAVVIAEKILDRALRLDPALVASVCAAALDHARGGMAIVLEVNPLDLPLVEAARAELGAAVGHPDAFVVRAVESIERGGCVVESSLGRVDARLETQLAAIRAALGVP